jgi:hypothetical protein
MTDDTCRPVVVDGEVIRVHGEPDHDRPTLGEATADLGCWCEECVVCGRFVYPAIHSCGGVPVTSAARARAGA